MYHYIRYSKSQTNGKQNNVQEINTVNHDLWRHDFAIFILAIVFRHIVGIPLRTHYAPDIAGLIFFSFFLYCYESQFMAKLKKSLNSSINNNCKYTDDILTDHNCFKFVKKKEYSREAHRRRSKRRTTRDNCAISTFTFLNVNWTQAFAVKDKIFLLCRRII